MTSKNQLTAYCLLAHVNDSDRGIQDLTQIFVPLIKKTLASLLATGVRAGNANDLKAEFDNLFNLDIPFGLTHSLMLQIEKESNLADAPLGLSVHNDGSFVLSEFEYTELDEVINQQAADIEFAEVSYSEFIERAGLKIEDEPSVFDFLDSHHQQLSGFFASRSDFDPNVEYTTPALFVESVKNDEKQFDILRRIYLGSLISSYLQLPVNGMNTNSKELVLDTSFLVSLLDLSSVEACHTCRMILEIAQKLSHKITVLDITIDETKALLERCSDFVGRTTLLQFVSPTSIEGGCARRKLAKTDLLRIASSLKKTLKNTYNISFHAITDRMCGKAKNSEIYKKITGRTHNPDGAHHDGIAAYYVASKRGNAKRSLLDTACWFVSSHDPHRGTGLRTKDDGSFFETIRAEYLLNVLWLSSPAARLQEVPAIGLSKLVASTIKRSLPSHVVLREFDENLKKFNSNELTEEDIALVANSTAVKSAEQLERLNSLAQTDKEEFYSNVLSIADTERERVLNLEKSVSRERVLRTKTEKEQKVVEGQLEKANNELFRIKSAELEQIKNKIVTENNALKIAIQKATTVKKTVRWMGVALVLSLAFGSWFLIQKFGWDTMEPIYFIIGSAGPILLALIVYAKWEENLKNTFERIENIVPDWFIEKCKSSESSISSLQKKLEKLQGELDNYPNS